MSSLYWLYSTLSANSDFQSFRPSSRSTFAARNRNHRSHSQRIASSSIRLLASRWHWTCLNCTSFGFGFVLRTWASKLHPFWRAIWSNSLFVGIICLSWSPQKWIGILELQIRGSRTWCLWYLALSFHLWILRLCTKSRNSTILENLSLKCSAKRYLGCSLVT